MKKRALSIFLALTLCLGLAISAMAASSEAIEAADRLNELGLFSGVGNNADGTPNYDLDRAPTRAEAVTLLVRLLGKETEAKAGNWTTPFTDVADWAKPYVGYAYANSLTSGTSTTTFSGGDTVSATQYLTFVLRALGYTSGADFQWDKAWEMTDELGITSGQYNASSAFTRGDAVIVSAAALDIKLKDGSKTLLEAIKENLAAAPIIGDFEITGTLIGAQDLVWIPTGEMTLTADGVTKTLEANVLYIYNTQNWSEEDWQTFYLPYANKTAYITGTLHYNAERDDIELEIITIELAE